MIKVIKFPKREDWPALVQRPSAGPERIETSVRTIIRTVRQEGDAALREYARLFDKVETDTFVVSREEFVAAKKSIPASLKAAIELAHSNITKFHAAQREEVREIETTPGVTCWRRSVPIERVGLYVPSGTAPLFSTVLMLGVPAVLAGCREIIICTPPLLDGSVAAATLYAAEVCGISTIYKVGGAQAIAAMAYGTETIPRVDKIFGPGNSYVTSAKQIVSTDVAIDMPAGPSEVAVLADSSSNPKFVAADLLSQAEHGADSQTVLVSDDLAVIEEVIRELESQIATLPRRDIATAAMQNSIAVLVEDPDAGMDLLNLYAPEHLILCINEADRFAEKVVNAGSVFLGNFSCESLGDYAAGTNHTLPTAGFARVFSGVSLDSFIKKITFQRVDQTGLKNIGPAVELMAEAEGLEAHKRAVTLRLEATNGI
ncbi:MAG TPA: histidinol dehydrogenase [Pyrinomonadaceae bacterium]|nr:histidinol dehydrogenase [Pyrinomonadaceae bacterium]